MCLFKYIHKQELESYATKLSKGLSFSCCLLPLMTFALSLSILRSQHTQS